MIVFEILFFFFAVTCFLFLQVPFFYVWPLFFIVYVLWGMEVSYWSFGSQVCVVPKCSALCFTPCMSEQTPWFRVQSLVSLEPLTVKE